MSAPRCFPLNLACFFSYRIGGEFDGGTDGSAGRVRHRFCCAVRVGGWADRLAGGAGMITVFEKIPDVFVQAYDGQFQTWAREFRTRGVRCCVEFSRRPGTAVLLDAEGRAVKRGAWLVAEVDRSRPQEPKIVIKPADDFAEELIAKHTRELQGYWFH